MLLPHEKLQEAELYIESQTKLIEELISLNLWSARRLKHQQYKDFAYDELDGMTNEKHERV